MLDTTDAYLMGRKIGEVVGNYELCSAFENGVRSRDPGRLTRLERELLVWLEERGGR